MLPFGLTSSPSTFERLMISVFQNKIDKYILVYLDNALVYSESAT